MLDALALLAARQRHASGEDLVAASWCPVVERPGGRPIHKTGTVIIASASGQTTTLLGQTLHESPLRHLSSG